MVNTTNLNPAAISYPVDVNCTLSATIDGPHTTVAVAAGGSTTVQHVPVGSSCAVQEHPLAAPSGNQTCPNPAWLTTYPSGSTVIMSGTGATLTVRNELACPNSTLTITKVSVVPTNMTGISTVNVVVQCTPGGPNTTVSVPVAGQTQLTVPTGSACTVTEVLPISTPSGCQWTGSQTPAGPINFPLDGTPQSVTVTNTCTPPPPGSLLVTKTFLNPPPVGALLPVNVTCGSLVDNFTLGAGSASSHVVTGIAGGTSCTVTETPPPGPIVTQSCFAAGGWNPPTYTPGQSVVIPGGGQQSVDIENSYTCAPPNGALLIHKDLFAGGRPFGNTSTGQQSVFQVSVTCGSNPPVILTLNAANGFQGGLNNLPQGTTCTIQELGPPSIPLYPQCSWGVTYPLGQTVTISGTLTTLLVANEFQCAYSRTAQPPTTLGIPRVNLTFDGPCALGAAHGATDAQGRFAPKGLRPGACRLSIAPDALQKAVEGMNGAPPGRSGSSGNAGVGEFVIGLQTAKRFQQVKIPCCDKASPSRGAGLDFTVSANDNAPPVVTVGYEKASRRR